MIRLLHLTALLLSATWLAAAHPGGVLPALLVAIAGIIGELLPSGSPRELGAPAAILVAAVFSYLLGGGGPGQQHALLGMLLVGLLLIPARPDALRMLAPLCGLELVACGLPGTGPGMWVSALFLTPLAVAALAGDAWSGARLGARSSQAPRLGWLRWAVLPAALAALCGLALMPAANALAPKPAQRAAKPKPPSVLPPRPTDGSTLEIGADGNSVPQDPMPAARLLMSQPPIGMVYLRASAAGLIQRELNSGAWRWIPSSGEMEAPATPPPADAHLADLVRMPGFGDVVFLPDDGDWCSLDELTRDGDGNRWRAGLGDAVRSYQVSLDQPLRLEPDPDAASIWRTVPPGLDGGGWDRIEDPAWRTLTPLIASARIITALQARCAYALKDLPQSSNPLFTFLFSEDARQRRGHCQYFAEACAILLRRAGHPARCVAGFASEEWDGSGIVFRRLHAHAWVEVLEQGRWHRIDPTPAVAHELVKHDLDETAKPKPPQLSEAVPLPERQAPAVRRHGWWIVLLLLPVPFLILLLRRRQRTRSRPIVRQRTDELVSLARELGIRVAAHDTAAVICAKLTARTGIDLSAELALYQAARFGDGPAPPPWPAERLRRTRPESESG